jgi:hypothetical protein
MKKYRAPLLVLAGVICVASLVTTVFATDNFTGTWKLNLEKSQYTPGPPPKSLTSRVEVIGDTVNFTFDGYDFTGKATIPDELSIKLDGKDYPIAADDLTRDTVAMKKIDDYTIEETNKKDGKVTTITRTKRDTMQRFDASDDISSRSSFEHRRIRGRQFSVELKSGQRMERLSRRTERLF